MNILGLLIIMVIAITAVFGIVLAANATNVTPVDTFGHTPSMAVNNTSSIAGNVTAAGVQVGGGLVIFVAAVIGVSVLLALALLASSKRHGSGRGF